MRRLPPKIVFPQRLAAGMTLIELMVALAVGSFLMIGAVTVFVESRGTFRVNESVARLQENARFVFDAIEPDIRMAHYWGLTTRSARIQGRAAPADPAGIGPADCGNNWTINVTQAVGGTNDGYGWACAPFGTAVADADTLVVRRVAEDLDPAPQAGFMYLQSARFQEARLFIGSAVPAGYAAASSQTHRLIVNGYYVSENSTLDTPGAPVPSLRVKTLTGGALGPRIVDQEVLPGVEDLQVQYGVDTDAPGAPDRGAIDRYVDPDDPLLDPLDPAFNADAEILAVRLWIRLRAENIEVGYTDDANYTYADQDWTANDAFRRLLVSKTIYLRNARPAR